jgi:hypothetical protein
LYTITWKRRSLFTKKKKVALASSNTKVFDNKLSASKDQSPLYTFIYLTKCCLEERLGRNAVYTEWIWNLWKWKCIWWWAHRQDGNARVAGERRHIRTSTWDPLCVAGSTSLPFPMTSASQCFPFSVCFSFVQFLLPERNQLRAFNFYSTLLNLIGLFLTSRNWVSHKSNLIWFLWTDPY